jgi:hypothetical protein
MAWEQDEVEGEALSLRRAAGVDLVTPVTGITLAQRIVGRQNVQWTRELDELGRPAQCLRRSDGTWLIQLALRLADQPVAANWWPCHEAAEIRLVDRPNPYVEQDIERLCNRITAAAIVPRPALRAAVFAWGLDLPRLATQFVVSEYTIALRLAEVMDYPVALLCEVPLFERTQLVVRKGPQIPLTDWELFRWAREARRPPARSEGVFRRRLTDRQGFHVFIGPEGGWDE